MTHLHTPFVFPDGRGNNVAARQHGWYQWPTGLRSPVWPAILGSLTILGMLLAFHQVVHEAVQQGELRQKANAVHAKATWRCKILPGRDASDSCLLELSARANGGHLLTAQNVLLANQ